MIFARIYLNLHEKFDSQERLTCFGSHTKKVLKVFMCMWRRKSQIQTYFDSQSHSSYNKNKSIETSVTKFSWILPGFLTSKLLEVGLYPTTCTTAGTGLEIKYRDPITVIHGIKY